MVSVVAVASAVDSVVKLVSAADSLEAVALASAAAMTTLATTVTRHMAATPMPETLALLRDPHHLQDQQVVWVNQIDPTAQGLTTTRMATRTASKPTMKTIMETTMEKMTMETTMETTMVLRSSHMIKVMAIRLMAQICMDHMEATSSSLF